MQTSPLCEAPECLGPTNLTSSSCCLDWPPGLGSVETDGDPTPHLAPCPEPAGCPSPDPGSCPHPALPVSAPGLPLPALWSVWVIFSHFCPPRPLVVSPKAPRSLGLEVFSVSTNFQEGWDPHGRVGCGRGLGAIGPVCVK